MGEISMTMFVKFEDSDSFNVEYSQHFIPNIGRWTIIWEETEQDYSGYAKLLAVNEVGDHREYAYVEWSYGSCPGCDPWMDLTEDEQAVEARKCIMHFVTESPLWRWIDMLRSTDDDKAPQLSEALSKFAQWKGDPHLAYYRKSELHD
jgi:hypothetical protein